MQLRSLALVTFIGAFAMSYAVGRKSFWLDEGVSFRFARVSPTELWHLASYESNMTLYYLLLHGWKAVFGDSEVALRSLSVVAAAASVPVLYLLARRLFGTRTAVVAAALLSVDGFFMAHAQQARGYSLAVLLVLVAALCLVIATERSATGPWMAFGVVAALAVYVHVFTVLAVGAMAVTVLALPAERRPLRRVLAAAVTAGVALVPFAVWTVRAGGSNQFVSVPRPTFGDLVDLVQAMGGGSTSLAVLVTAPAWVVALSVTRTAWQQRATAPDVAWRHLLVWSWLLVPIVAMVGVSLARPVFVPRYLLFSMPAAVLLAAVGIASLRSAALVGAAVGAALALSGANLVALYGTPQEDWRDAERFVRDRARQGDVVFLSAPYVRVVFDYYTRHDGVGEHISQEDSPEQQLVEVGGTNADRAWLVVSHYEVDRRRPMGDRLSAALAGRGTLVEERAFTAVHVRLYDLR
jgi:mannosyltransferase